MSSNPDAQLSALIDIPNSSFVRVCESDVLFRPMLQFMSRSASVSFECDQSVAGGKSKKKTTSHPLTVSGLVAPDGDADLSTHLTVGLGVHPVDWEGEKLFVSYQRIGEPVGTYSEALFFEEFVIYAKGLGEKTKKLLHEFVEHVFNLANSNEDENTYKIYTWEIEERWWKTSAVRQKRPLESVVLPEETKNLIISDLEKFLADATAEWYAKHGIVYKRSYLLFGPPGTGKTSFLSAIASKYDRNLCFLQAGHPLLTDSSLHSALNQAPENSILVMEDIDSLFTVDRKSDSKSPLTFSGILNALDGLASPQGNLFFLTTNHPERLDPAMLRHGRVDVKAEFPAATEAQVAGLFKSFYPEAPVDHCVQFSQALKQNWGKMNLAALQDFFIQNREHTASEALKHVDSWIKQQSDAEKSIKDFEEKNLNKKEENEEKGEDEEEEEGAPSAPAAPAVKESQQVNIQINLPVFYFAIAIAATYFLLKARKHE